MEPGDVLPGEDGQLLQAGDAGVVRYRARHPVGFRGLSAGERIFEAVTVELDTVFPERVTEVSVAVDGRPLERSPDGTVRLDPDVLKDGAHVLELTAVYDDGTLPAHRSLPFQVAVDASWAEHIAPIFDERCSSCHAAGGSAPTELSSAEKWEENIEALLFNVRMGRMPLNGEPLTEDEIALIEVWSVTGFPP
jgi:hypothetical protein